MAERQAEWIADLGPYPTHQLLSVRDGKAAPIDYSRAGFGEVKEIVVRDAPESWPEGPNMMLARAGKHVEHVQKVPWLWCEADTVPMRAGWLDEIEAEYAKALKVGKVFLGDLQRPLPGKPHFVQHSSGLCVYPAALTQHAGEAYQAGNVPFDSVAGPSVVPKMMQSELLYHLWKAPAFESWADVERRIFAVRPKCAVYHSDKSGSLLGLLREKRNGGDAKCHDNQQQPTITVSDTPLVSAPDAGNAAPTFEPDSAAETASTAVAPVTSWETADHSPTCSAHAQTPWASKPDSIAEIRQLAARLMQFSDSSPHVRLVRAELHDAGVIVLSYRYRKRGGWKRKKGSK